jgi:hypothetical protein
MRAPDDPRSPMRVPAVAPVHARAPARGTDVPSNAFGERRIQRFRKLAAWVFLFCAWTLTTRAGAEGIEVLWAQVATSEENYVLNADLAIQLNPTVHEALSRGVVLHFVIDFDITRPRWYWLDDKTVQSRREFAVSYNALTRQYRLIIGSLFQSFPTLEQVLGVMSRVRNWPVADKGTLAHGVQYQATLRVRLDVSRLPTPFQVSALASREWELSSDWYRFPVVL